MLGQGPFEFAEIGTLSVKVNRQRVIIAKLNSWQFPLYLPEDIRDGDGGVFDMEELADIPIRKPQPG
jgi:hypothetical protein